MDMGVMKSEERTGRREHGDGNGEEEGKAHGGELGVCEGNWVVSLVE